MHGQLEFHDSEVHRIDLRTGGLTIGFSAAFVQAEGVGAGYVQSLVMDFTGATVEGALANGVGRLSHGRLWVHGRALPALPFPYTAPGPVRVALQFTNGVCLDIVADGLVCQLTGDPRFVESFAC